MNDQSKRRDQARQERLRAALRENLRRRKAQAKARSTDAEPGPVVDRAADAELQRMPDD